MAVARSVDVEASSRSFASGLRAARSLVFLSSLLACAAAPAVGLGPAAIHSGLGERLRLTFPVSLQQGEEVGCVQVRPKGDDLPSVPNTSSSILRSGSRIRVQVTSAAPVNEPAIGLVVSVGCSTPVSREYVLFLDPPDVSSAEAAASTGVQPAEVDAPARAGRASSDGGIAAGAAAPRVPRQAAPRRPRATAPSSPAAGADALPGSAAPSPRRPATGRPVPGAAPSDRLTVAPTEPRSPAVGTDAASTPKASAPPQIGTPTVPPAAATATGAAATSAAASNTNEAAAREQLLRQQQAELQQQVKTLGEQIAALRVQTAALMAREQAHESSTLSSTLPWLLIALAILAALVAAWMAWRYLQLRRSIDDAAWWTGNTVNPAADRETVGPETRSGPPSLNPATRLVARPMPQPDTRAGPVAPPPPAPVANPDRPRPAARDVRYAAPIDTDFTVSDIEAAMATVRTVSPRRGTPRPGAEDGEFAELGDPTLPHPYTEPMPSPPRAAAPPQRAIQRTDEFVDLDLPPVSQPPSPAVPHPREKFNGAAPAPTPVEPGRARGGDVAAPPPPARVEPPITFDPLASDSFNRTVVEQSDQVGPIDFTTPGAPTALDFELASATQFAPPDGVDDDADLPQRHGATALDDLFRPLDAPEADTILYLDERDDSPLRTTVIDRLATTAVDGTNEELLQASTRFRIARFADLMNQVDEAADTDPLRAIAHLRQYVLRDEQIPTLLWLRLFELYKAVDKKPVYEALSEHFARRYHRPMVDWTETLADRAPQSPLSSMGAIDRQVEAMWGTEEGLELLRSLLCDRNQDDSITFNAVLQRDLLDAAKVFPATSNDQGSTRRAGGA